MVAADAAEVRAPAPVAAAVDLRARLWGRVIDQQWRRTSYSGLTAAAHGAEPHRILADEPAGPMVVDPDPALATRSPMATLPGGAAFGSLVHTVYETLDARGDDWQARLRAEIERALRRWPIEGVDAGTLAEAMAPTLETPLGLLGEGTTLRSFGDADRLSEFEFEFALDAPEATPVSYTHLTLPTSDLV